MRPTFMSGSLALLLSLPPAAGAADDLRAHTSGWANVRSYGAPDDGVTDAAPAFAAALAASKRVFVPDPAVAYAIKSTIKVPPDTVIVGANKRSTKLLLRASVDMFTLGDGAGLSDLYLEGNAPAFSGRAIVIGGADGRQSVRRVKAYNFDGHVVEFTDTRAGSQSVFEDDELWRYDSGPDTGRYAVKIPGTRQLAAVPRKFHHIESDGGLFIDLGGANDLFLSGSFIGGLRYGPESRGVQVTATRIANQHTLLVDGHNNTITGCDINPVVSLAPGADNIAIASNSYNNDGGQPVPTVQDRSGNGRNAVEVRTFAYTPALTSGGTQPMLGDGTLRGEWARSGTMVSVTVELIVGSTTRLGSGELRFSLPLTPRNGTVSPPSVPQQFGAGIVKQGAIVTIVAPYVTAQVGTLSALLPGTAGAVSASQPAPGLRPGDSLRWSITYFL